MVGESDWDVVLLDISMPDMNGIDTLKQIKHWKPKLPVLILTVHREENYAINLLRGGARGYLHKECTPEELVDAIRTVASGRRYVSPALRHQLAAGVERRGAERTTYRVVSARIPDILQTCQRTGRFPKSRRT